MRFTVVLLAIGLAFAACNRGGGTTDSAPRTSGAVCAACGAIIGDEAFAAQYRLSSGTVKSFDDPGCLFRALRGESGDPTVIRFRARDSDRWLSASEVWFATTPETKSPHGYGWAAYASFADAQDAVAKAGSGEILPFDQARERIAAPAKE